MSLSLPIIWGAFPCNYCSCLLFSSIEYCGGLVVQGNRHVRAPAFWRRRFWTGLRDIRILQTPGAHSAAEFMGIVNELTSIGLGLRLITFVSGGLSSIVVPILFLRVGTAVHSGDKVASFLDLPRDRLCRGCRSWNCRHISIFRRNDLPRLDGWRCLA